MRRDLLLYAMLLAGAALPACRERQCETGQSRCTIYTNQAQVCDTSGRWISLADCDETSIPSVCVYHPTRPALPYCSERKP